MAADRALFGMRYRIIFKHDEGGALRAGHNTTTIAVGRLAGLLNVQMFQAVFPEFMK